MTLYEKIKAALFAGILLCMLVIAQKPVPVFHTDSPSVSMPSLPDPSQASVVQLDRNRIALVDTRNGSSTFGKIVVLEYDETAREFKQVAQSFTSFQLDFRMPK